MTISLLPETPGAWPEFGVADLFAVERAEREAVQLEAIRLRFARLRDKLPALRKLAEKQGVAQIDSLQDLIKICFDHRVMKNYPLAILENRDFPKLTAWLDKLTLHDLSRVDLGGLKSIDSWIERLQDFGLIIGTSSGTTGKLSFMPRSKSELSAWRSSWLVLQEAATGVDPLANPLPSFSTGYRSGHQMAMKPSQLFAQEMYGGRHNLYTLYNGHMSADLMALSGKMQAAEDKGELDRLDIDPELIEQRRQMIEQGRRRPQDMQIWFEKLLTDFRGQRVRIGGMSADLYRVAQAGLDKGLKADFAPGSLVATGGGHEELQERPGQLAGDHQDLLRGRSPAHLLRLLREHRIAAGVRLRLLSFLPLHRADDDGKGRRASAPPGGADRPAGGLRPAGGELLGRLRHRRRGDDALRRRLPLRLEGPAHREDHPPLQRDGGRRRQDHLRRLGQGLRRVHGLCDGRSLTADWGCAALA